MTADSPSRRLRVLHLGFEDHRRPGSGGGSARNRAVNARLARHHDITMVTARYPGAEDRVEDGVRHVHLGIGRGYMVSLLSYFACLPWFLLRHSRHHDLVVEEFAAPLGSVSAPRWTRRPTLAVVQWLDAAGKSRQYHLPFLAFESLGLRSHRRAVAVSHDLADQIGSRAPALRVDVVPNGVEPEAFEVREPDSGDVVYLGRLEIAQKGLDLLCEAWAGVAHRVGGRLVIAGDGPDRARLERLCERLGIADSVVMLGRVEGEEKLRLLAGARVVAMPSRYETFGMVAVEALACGSPVVAFAIPCLREVVPEGSGVLVPDLLDTGAYGEALADAWADPGLKARAASNGRDFARRFEWDAIAREQETVYLDVAQAGAASRPDPAERR
ncbi:glycosyltransferase family 4 protein [Nocardioides kribbensis]